MRHRQLDDEYKYKFTSLVIPAAFADPTSSIFGMVTVDQRVITAEAY